MSPSATHGGLIIRKQRVPQTTRHSSMRNFASSSEANSFFRADVQPLAQTKQKRQFFALQKKLVAGELDTIQKRKQEILHKSLQLFFRIHFLADKRRRRVAHQSQLYMAQ